jgi:hypothetical protein
MVSITRNVSDIPAGDLPAFEHLIGVPLRSSQKVILQVVERETALSSSPSKADVPQLPEWCNVYEGLSDEEIDRLDAAIQQRLNLTRDIEL